MSQQPRHRYAADLPHGLPGPLKHIAPEVPAASVHGGTRRARPVSARFEPVSQLKDVKRRFLAYSFPPRSPDPHHLAVLARSDLVGAACHPHRHHPDRAAPSFTVLLRQDQWKRSHTSSRTNSASRRTRRRLKTDPVSKSPVEKGSIFGRR